MTFKETFDQVGYFEIKIGELRPFETVVVEMATIGITEIVGRKYYGVFIHHKFKFEDSNQEEVGIMNCPWDIEARIHFSEESQIPNVYVLSHQNIQNSSSNPGKNPLGFSDAETEDTLTPQLQTLDLNSKFSKDVIGNTVHVKFNPKFGVQTPNQDFEMLIEDLDMYKNDYKLSKRIKQEQSTDESQQIKLFKLGKGPSTHSGVPGSKFFDAPEYCCILQFVPQNIQNLGLMATSQTNSTSLKVIEGVDYTSGARREFKFITFLTKDNLKLAYKVLETMVNNLPEEAKFNSYMKGITPYKSQSVDLGAQSLAEFIYFLKMQEMMPLNGEENSKFNMRVDEFKQNIRDAINTSKDADKTTLIIISDGLGFKSSQIMPILENMLTLKKTRIFSICLGNGSNFINLKRITSKYSGETMYLPQLPSLNRKSKSEIMDPRMAILNEKFLIFLQSIVKEPLQNFDVDFQREHFTLISPLPNLYSSYSSYKPISMFCLLSTQFPGSTRVKITFFNPTIGQTEVRIFEIDANQTEQGSEMHKICVKKFLDTWKSGDEKSVYIGDDLTMYGKDWMEGMLGVEYGVLVEGRTGIVCVGEEEEEYVHIRPRTLGRESNKLKKQVSEKESDFGGSVSDGQMLEELGDDDDDELENKLSHKSVESSSDEEKSQQSQQFKRMDYFEGFEQVDKIKMAEEKKQEIQHKLKDELKVTPDLLDLLDAGLDEKKQLGKVEENVDLIDGLLEDSRQKNQEEREIEYGLDLLGGIDDYARPVVQDRRKSEINLLERNEMNESSLKEEGITDLLEMAEENMQVEEEEAGIKKIIPSPPVFPFSRNKNFQSRIGGIQPNPEMGGGIPPPPPVDNTGYQPPPPPGFAPQKYDTQTSNDQQVDMNQRRQAVNLNPMMKNFAPGRPSSMNKSPGFGNRSNNQLSWTTNTTSNQRSNFFNNRPMMQMPARDMRNQTVQRANIEQNTGFDQTTDHLEKLRKERKAKLAQSEQEAQQQMAQQVDPSMNLGYGSYMNSPSFDPTQNVYSAQNKQNWGVPGQQPNPYFGQTQPQPQSQSQVETFSALGKSTELNFMPNMPPKPFSGKNRQFKQDYVDPFRKKEMAKPQTMDHDEIYQNKGSLGPELPSQFISKAGGRKRGRGGSQMASISNRSRSRNKDYSTKEMVLSKKERKKKKKKRKGGDSSHDDRSYQPKPSFGKRNKVSYAYESKSKKMPFSKKLQTKTTGMTQEFSKLKSLNSKSSRLESSSLRNEKNKESLSNKLWNGFKGLFSKNIEFESQPRSVTTQSRSKLAYSDDRSMNTRSSKTNFNVYHQEKISKPIEELEFFNKTQENSIYSQMKTENSLLSDLSFNKSIQSLSKKRRKPSTMSYSQKNELIIRLRNSQTKQGFWNFNSGILKKIDPEGVLFTHLSHLRDNTVIMTVVVITWLTKIGNLSQNDKTISAGCKWLGKQMKKNTLSNELSNCRSMISA